MSRAIRLVLALYPRAVRDRYGPEIADLLAHSRRPIRDLSDVARCALADRVRALRYARLRPHVNATAGLLAAPVAFAGGYLALYFVGSVLCMALAAVAPPAGYRAASIVLGAAALPVAAGAIWLGGHTRLPFTPVLAPVALGVGVLPPVLLVAEPGTAWPTVAALGCWWAVTGPLCAMAYVWVRRGLRRHAMIAMALGGLLACELAFTVFGLSLFGSAFSVFGIYPVTVLGIDPDGRVAEAARLLPVLFTASSAYALGLVTAVRPFQAEAAHDEPAVTT